MKNFNFATFIFFVRGLPYCVFFLFRTVLFRAIINGLESHIMTVELGNGDEPGASNSRMIKIDEVFFVINFQLTKTSTQFFHYVCSFEKSVFFAVCFFI